MSTRYYNYFNKYKGFKNTMKSTLKTKAAGLYKSTSKTLRYRVVFFLAIFFSVVAFSAYSDLNTLGKDLHDKVELNFAALKTDPNKSNIYLSASNHSNDSTKVIVKYLFSGTSIKKVSTGGIRLDGRGEYIFDLAGSGSSKSSHSRLVFTDELNKEYKDVDYKIISIAKY